MMTIHSPTYKSKEEIARLFDLPLMDLLMKAQNVHRQHFNAQENLSILQVSAQHSLFSNSLQMPLENR